MDAVVIGLNVIVLSALAFVLWRQYGMLHVTYGVAWASKLGAGLLLGVLYTYYYDVGDTFAFFNDGVALARLARKDFSAYLQFLWSGDQSLLQGTALAVQQSRSLFLSKTISLFNLITFDNYWLTSLYLSTVSFAASCYLVAILTRYFPQLKTAAVVAFLLFPSVVFWSSGIIKESLALAALYMLTAVFIQVWHRQLPRVAVWPLALVAVWVLVSLRYYFAAVFLPVVFTSLCTQLLIMPRIKTQRATVEIALWCIMLLFPLMIASVIHPNFYPHNFLSVIVSNYEIFQRVSDPGDAIVFRNLAPNMANVLLHTPWAWVSGLFRPFPWEAGTLFQAAMAAENMVLLVATITALPALRQLPRSPHRLLLVALVVYTGMLCVFITLSTPNFGTLCRYRVGYVPFFVFLVLIPRFSPQLTTKFSWLRVKASHK